MKHLQPLSFVAAYLCRRDIRVLRPPSHLQMGSTSTIAKLPGESSSMFQCLRITSRSGALAFLASVWACLPLSMTAAATASRGDVVVATVHGTVSATMAGMTVPLSAGAILQLPATVRTGADGAVELRQGTSTFAAA